MFNRLKEKVWARYIVIGGVSYSLELCFLFSLVKGFGFERTAATALSFWVGFVAAFFLQKTLAFKDFNKEKSIVIRQTAKYTLLVCFNYLFTLILVGLLPEAKLIFSRTIALMITTTWNFYIYDKVIFGKG